MPAIRQSNKYHTYMMIYDVQKVYLFQAEIALAQKLMESAEIFLDPFSIAETKFNGSNEISWVPALKIAI